MALFGPPNIEKMMAKKNIEGLEKALGYKDPEVRMAAAKALGNLDWKPGGEETSAWYWIARCNWEKAIAIGVPAIKPLITVLKYDDTHMREAAAKALSRIGKPAAKPLVSAMKVLKKGVREAAGEAIVRVYKEDPFALLDILPDLTYIKWVYGPLIKLGRAGTEKLLINMLKWGDMEMTLTALNSGNKELESAARNWARTHNYNVIESGLRGGPRWGVGL